MVWNVLVSLLLVILVVVMIYLSYKDYKFAEFPSRKPFVLMWIPIILINYLLTGDLVGIILAFFIMSSWFYLSCLVTNSTVFGTIDILVAPLFTTWFGYYSFIYLIVFYLLSLLFKITVVRRFVFKRDDGIPLIPIMTLTFMTLIWVLPTSITSFLSQGLL